MQADIGPDIHFTNPSHTKTHSGCHAMQERELKRLQVARAEQLAEVAEVEAQEAGVTAHNTTLNREANQLQMEVCKLADKTHA
jgi:hypothetical protein